MHTDDFTFYLCLDTTPPSTGEMLVSSTLNKWRSFVTFHVQSPLLQVEEPQMFTEMEGDQASLSPDVVVKVEVKQTCACA
jgi:hypothetical protein